MAAGSTTEATETTTTIITIGTITIHSHSIWTQASSLRLIWPVVDRLRAGCRRLLDRPRSYKVVHPRLRLATARLKAGTTAGTTEEVAEEEDMEEVVMEADSSTEDRRRADTRATTSTGMAMVTTIGMEEGNTMEAVEEVVVVEAEEDVEAATTMEVDITAVEEEVDIVVKSRSLE